MFIGKMPMPNNAEWLKLIREAAVDSGRVNITHHARQRMSERQVSLREVLNCLRTGTFSEPPVDSLKHPGHLECRICQRAGLCVVLGFDEQQRPLVLDVITVMRE